MSLRIASRREPHRPVPKPSGYLALAYTGKRLPLQVLRSAAGHYIGTADEDGPVSRESVEYFRSQHAADHALETRPLAAAHPSLTSTRQEPFHEPVFAPRRI